MKPEKAESENGVKLTVDGDGVVSTDRNPNGGVDKYRLTVKTKLAGMTGFRLDAMEHASLPAQGPGRAGNGNFVLNEMSVTAGDKPLAIARAAATLEQPGFSAAATLDGNTEKLNGWAVMGGTGVAQAIGFELAEPLGGGEELTLVFTLRQLHGDNHTLGRFRLAATTMPKPTAMTQVGLPSQDIVRITQAAVSSLIRACPSLSTVPSSSGSPAIARSRAGRMPSGTRSSRGSRARRQTRLSRTRQTQRLIQRLTAGRNHICSSTRRAITTSVCRLRRQIPEASLGPTA